MKKQPQKNTAAFKVLATKTSPHRPHFTRCGINFGREPIVVERKTLTPKQAVELLNTDTLYVEELAKLPEAAG